MYKLNFQEQYYTSDKMSEVRKRFTSNKENQREVMASEKDHQGANEREDER